MNQLWQLDDKQIKVLSETKVMEVFTSNDFHEEALASGQFHLKSEAKPKKLYVFGEVNAINDFAECIQNLPCGSKDMTRSL